MVVSVILIFPNLRWRWLLFSFTFRSDVHRSFAVYIVAAGSS